MNLTDPLEMDATAFTYGYAEYTPRFLLWTPEKREVEHILDLLPDTDYLYGHHLPSEMPYRAVLVYGGDGTMLDALKLFKLPLVGLNGGSLGALMWHDLEEAKTFMTSLSGFSTLPSMVVEDHENTPAFNDIVVERNSTQAIKPTIYINNSPVVEMATCDGVIISTPMGTTGYNLTISQSVIEDPGADIRIISLIGSREIIRSFIATPGTVDIKLHETNKRPARCAIDGQPLMGSVGSEISINMKSPTQRHVALPGLSHRCRRK